MTSHKLLRKSRFLTQTFLNIFFIKKNLVNSCIKIIQIFNLFKQSIFIINKYI